MAFNPGLAGIGVLSASAVVGGGVAVSGVLNEDTSLEEDIKASQNPELKIKSTEWDYWHALRDDDGFPGNYKGKYGDKHRRHFVGIDKSSGKNSTYKDNDFWWKWSYKENYRSNATEGFNNSIVRSWQQLKEACQKVYKGTIDKSKGIITAEDGTKFKEVNVWSFCTPVDQVPVTVSSGEYSQGTIGETEKSKLSSIKGNNDYFWFIKGYLFFSYDKPATKSHNFFAELYNKRKGQYMSIREWCEKAYKKNTSSSSTAESPSTNEVVKYCGVEESSS